MNKEILKLYLLKNEFEELINDDEDFKEQWASSSGEYTEDSFWEWFQDVVNSCTKEDFKKYIEVI